MPAAKEGRSSVYPQDYGRYRIVIRDTMEKASGL